MKYLQQGCLRFLACFAAAIQPDNLQKLCHRRLELVGVLQCALRKSDSGGKVVRRFFDAIFEVLNVDIGVNA